MKLFWVTLVLLQRGCTLVPVITVELGEPATFKCALAKIEISHRELSWYKQRSGETLTLMVTVRRSVKPVFSPEFSESRFKIESDQGFTNLTILRSSEEDEGMYHCAVTEWIRKPEWSGMYLVIRGNTERRSNLTDVQGPTVFDSKFSLKENTLTLLLCAALTLTLIVIAVLIHAIKTNDSVNKASDALRENADVWRSGLLKSLKRDQVYSAVVFTSMKSKKAKAAEKERIYAAVKAFGLDQ